MDGSKWLKRILEWTLSEKQGWGRSPKKLRDDMEAVSYTHLDVYKRQVLSWPARQSRGVTRLSGLMVLGSRRRSPVRSCRYCHRHRTTGELLIFFYINCKGVVATYPG